MPRKLGNFCIVFLGIIQLVTAANSSLSDIRNSHLTWRGGFDRATCRDRTAEYVKNGTLAPDSEVFFKDEGGKIWSQGQDIILTLPGCKAMCGERMEWYRDSGPRISTWVIPIFILISNVELSPLDKRRFTAIIHIIGDPIDSIWSLVHKIDALDQCYTLAAQYTSSSRFRRVIATVFAGLEEVKGGELTSNFLQTIIEGSDLTQVATYQKWSLAAIDLADSRSDEILRTILAIILYFYTIITSFVEEVGGSQTSQPGGRIGTAMFISWLVPLVLLSNIIGGFTSRRSAYKILIRFAEDTGLHLDFASKESTHLGRSESVRTGYFQSLGWSGAIYSFRTWKTTYLIREPQRLKTLFIFCISIAPICIGMSGGFIIIWYALPVGFSCRHFWLIGIFIMYFISAFITWISNSKHFSTGVYHWHFVLWKDGLIGISSLLMIFLSSSGLFNSCFCWSGFFFYGSGARVVMNGDPFYKKKNDTVYPAVVAFCMFLQLAVFVVVCGYWWNGLQVMRWSEKARVDEWTASGGGRRLSHAGTAMQSDEDANLTVSNGDLPLISAPIVIYPPKSS